MNFIMRCIKNSSNKTRYLNPSATRTETLFPAFPQPQNAKPVEGKTKNKKCCLNERWCGISTIHSGNIFLL